MAEKKTYADVLGQGKIGTYQEAPGGGTPLKSGEKAPSKEWVKEHRKMQPRDEDGQFTYNAANAKELKYGPSRGTTIPPFLRGVEMSFCVKKKDVILDAEGKRWLSGLNMSAADIIRTFREWDKDKGFKELSKEMSRKRGRKSKIEKDLIDKKKLGVIFAKTEHIDDTKRAVAGLRRKYTLDVVRYADAETFLQRFAANTVLTKEVKKAVPTYKQTKFPFTPMAKPATPPTPPTSAPASASPTPSASVAPAAPAAPKPAPKPTFKKDFDFEMAKSDPNKFIETHEDLLADVIDYAGSKGFDTDLLVDKMDELVSYIADAQIKSPADLLKAFDISADEAAKESK